MPNATDTGSAARTRVLVVSHLFPTSQDPTVGPWVAEQVDALSHYADVEVLCCARTGRDETLTRDSGVHVTYRDTTTAFTGRAGLLAGAWRYGQHLRAFLRESASPPQVIHSHFGFPDAVVVGSVARRAAIPHVATLHGSDVERVLTRKDPLGWGLARSIRRAAAVVCVSDALAQRTRSLLTEPRAIDVIPTGVDAGLFNLGRKQTRSGALFVGSLSEVKNPRLLIDAWSAVAAVSPIPLTIVGAGEMRGELELMVRERGLEDIVRFVGTLGRAEVAGRMSEAKLLVLTSRNEGWGAVVAEALACGTPVVATRVGGLPEIVTSPDGGRLVASQDPQDFAHAVLEVTEREWDPATVASSSGAPTVQDSAHKLVGVYKRVLA